MPPIDDPNSEPRPPVPSTEAAKYLGLHRGRIPDLIKRGHLKATRNASGGWMVDADSLDHLKKNPPKSGFPYGRHRVGGQIGGGKMRD